MRFPKSVLNKCSLSSPDPPPTVGWRDALRAVGGFKVVASEGVQGLPVQVGWSAQRRKRMRQNKDK